MVVTGEPVELDLMNAQMSVEMPVTVAQVVTEPEAVQVRRVPQDLQGIYSLPEPEIQIRQLLFQVLLLLRFSTQTPLDVQILN